ANRREAIYAEDTGGPWIDSLDECPVAGGEARVAGVDRANGVATDRQGVGRRAGGLSAAGTYRAAEVTAVNLELHGAGRRAGGRGVGCDRWGEGGVLGEQRA